MPNAATTHSASAVEAANKKNAAAFGGGDMRYGRGRKNPTSRIGMQRSKARASLFAIDWKYQRAYISIGRTSSYAIEPLSIDAAISASQNHIIKSARKACCIHIYETVCENSIGKADGFER